MSLDITFYTSEKTIKTCFHCDSEHEIQKEVESFNITHNLSNMAVQAGVYNCLWGATDNGFFKASQIIEKLHRGINRMEKEPAYFKTMDAKNGWGTYDDFLPWLKKVLAFCTEHPDLEIHISR